MISPSISPLCSSENAKRDGQVITTSHTYVGDEAMAVETEEKYSSSSARLCIFSSWAIMITPDDLQSIMINYSFPQTKQSYKSQLNNLC